MKFLENGTRPQPPTSHCHAMPCNMAEWDMWVMLHGWMGHVMSHMNVACHIWMCHVTHDYVTWHVHIYMWHDMSHSYVTWHVPFICDMTCPIQPYVTYEWVTLHMTKACHTQISHVAPEFYFRRRNGSSRLARHESCYIWIWIHTHLSKNLALIKLHMGWLRLVGCLKI